MIKKIIIPVLATTLLCSCSTKSKFVKNNYDFAEIQTENMINLLGNKIVYPRTTQNDGTIQYTSGTSWTNGFFPGSLWYIYEETNKPQWEKEAKRFTDGLENIQYMTSNHDIGFMMYCSYGNQYRLSKDEKEKARIKAILVQSAESLITRFNPKVGCIESWNSRKSWDGKTVWNYPVIIDNMLNLELLYFASQVTGNPKYADIATKHATTTMNNHFRKDYSSYHVVNYDENTGKAINHQTCQGYSDNSTWARGQAWAIYGYTMVYRETKDPKFLDFAEKVSNFYLDNDNLPKDMIPYWDFNANQKGYNPDFKWNPELYKVMPRDASAAAVVTSALFELSKYSSKYGDKFRKAAIKGLKSLASDKYRAKVHENNNFILMHSTGSLPHGAEIDKPLVYADYYFLEALLRYKAMNEK